MKGVIKLIIKEKHIKVKGHAVDADPMSQIAIVDALMSTFEMKGEVRKEVCDALMYVDAKRAEREETEE